MANSKLDVKRKGKNQQWFTKRKEDKDATTKKSRNTGNYEFCEAFVLAGARTAPSQTGKSLEDSKKANTQTLKQKGV
ncbi:MAG TPA: hypothetical protein VI685_15265 [Candidatus Angelobacter sp.]